MGEPELAEVRRGRQLREEEVEEAEGELLERVVQAWAWVQRGRRASC